MKRGNTLLSTPQHKEKNSNALDKASNAMNCITKATQQCTGNEKRGKPFQMSVSPAFQMPTQKAGLATLECTFKRAFLGRPALTPNTDVLRCTSKMTSILLLWMITADMAIL